MAHQTLTTTLPATLDDIIDTHGLFAVLRALMARPFRPRRLPPLGLSNHLRRDVGLDPLPPFRDPLL